MFVMLYIKTFYTKPVTYKSINHLIKWMRIMVDNEHIGVPDKSSFGTTSIPFSTIGGECEIFKRVSKMGVKNFQILYGVTNRGWSWIVDIWSAIIKHLLIWDTLTRVSKQLITLKRVFFTNMIVRPHKINFLFPVLWRLKKWCARAFFISIFCIFYMGKGFWDTNNFAFSTYHEKCISIIEVDRNIVYRNIK